MYSGPPSFSVNTLHFGHGLKLAIVAGCDVWGVDAGVGGVALPVDVGIGGGALFADVGIGGGTLGIAVGIGGGALLVDAGIGGGALPVDVGIRQAACLAASNVLIAASSAAAAAVDSRLAASTRATAPATAFAALCSSWSKASCLLPILRPGAFMPRSALLKRKEEDVAPRKWVCLIERRISKDSRARGKLHELRGS